VDSGNPKVLPSALAKTDTTEATSLVMPVIDDDTLLQSLIDHLPFWIHLESALMVG